MFSVFSFILGVFREVPNNFGILLYGLRTFLEQFEDFNIFGFKITGLRY